jgi:Type I restriction modification DNA specificity domain
LTKLPQGQGDDERLANDTNRGDYGGNFGRVEGGRVMILSLERSPWQKSKLGELVNDLTKSRWISVSGDDDVIDPTIKSATHTISVGQITPAVSVKITKRLEILPGDLVFSRLHTQNGAFAYSTVRFTATSTFIPLQVKEGIVNKRFLFWALHIWIPTLSTSDSVGRETYKTEDILSLEIPLPSLSEQQRIVARLEALARRVEEARGLRRAAVEEVEALLKSTMRGVFKSTAEIQNVSLENVCAAIIDNLHSNPVYSEDGTVPCIRSSDVGWGKLFLNTAQKTNETEYRKRTVRAEPIEDDVVLVREGGGTGKAAIVGREQRFSSGQRVMMLRPNKNYCSSQVSSLSIIISQRLRRSNHTLVQRFCISTSEYRRIAEIQLCVAISR